MTPWKIPAYTLVAMASIACAALQPGHACGLAPVDVDLVALPWSGDSAAAPAPAATDTGVLRQATLQSGTRAASAAHTTTCQAASCP